MNSKLIKFRFKGDRNYVQGPDIFNEILNYIHETLNFNFNFIIDVSFHKIVNKHLILNHYVGDLFVRPLDASVAAKVNFKNDIHWFILKESDENIVCRYEYNEEKFITTCKIYTEQKLISCIEESPFTFIETIVAMNKALHLSIYPDIVGKWLFVRGQLTKFEKFDCNDLKIRLVSNLNNKFTKSEVICNEKSVGFVYFSLN